MFVPLPTKNSRTIFRLLWKTEVGSQSSHQHRPAGCHSGALVDGAKLQYKRLTEPWFFLKCVFNFWKDLNTIFFFTSGSSQDCNHFSDFSDKVRQRFGLWSKTEMPKLTRQKSISIKYLRIKKWGAIWTYWDDRWEPCNGIIEIRGQWERTDEPRARLRGRCCCLELSFQCHKSREISLSPKI